MPNQPGPPAGAQQIPEPPVPLTLDVKGDNDSWVGTLEVHWFDEDRVWCWRLANSHRKLIQDGPALQMAGEQSHEQAMKVLLQFMLATADRPLTIFYDATTVWAVTNRKALAKALGEL
jgi:hypothetical protein